MNYQELKTEIKSQIEFAPFGEPAARGLRGWWIPVVEKNTGNGLGYICSKCSSRIIARGFSLPAGAEAVFGEGPVGVCVHCG